MIGKWSRGAKVLALTSIGVTLVSLDISIVNVAFGAIAKDFPESRRTLTWVFSAYNIAYAAGLLTAGRLADAFGRKRAFLTGLSIFMVGSLLCAFAPSALMLVTARALQAIGGAVLTPSSLALVLPEFPVEKRSAAIGVWGAVGAVAAASGPIIGGFLVDTFSWHAVFLVNVPLCLLALSVGVKLLTESRDETAPHTVDYFGAIIAVFSVGLLTLMIVQSDEWGWLTQRALIVLALAVASLFAFIMRCRMIEHPILDLALLKLPFVRAAAISGFGFTMGFFSLIFVNTQWLQTVWNYSPSRSGLAGIPGPVMAAAVAAPAGRFAQRIGHEKVVAAGTLIVFTGYFFLSFLINETPHYATHYLPITIYTGIGVGLCISTISSSATAFLPQSRFAMGSALNNTFRQIGAALGVAVVSSILLASANSDSSHGFVVAWRLMSIVILFSGVSMLVIYRPPRTEDLIASSSTI